MKTFVESVDEFVKACNWLGPEHQIAITSLYRMAQELDQEINPPMMSAFGLAYRSLAKLAPKEEATDELDALLKR